MINKIILILFILSLIVLYYFNYIEYYSQIQNYRKIKDYTRWILSDKYIAKLYAEKNGFSVPKTYQLVKYPKNIDFDNLPDNVVIKPTDLCNSGGVYLFKNNKNIITNEKLNKENIVKELNNIRAKVKNQYYMHNLMYDGLVPYTGIIVEELLLDKDGNVPFDIKCYAFNGRVYLIALTSNRRFKSNKQLFDSIWVTRDWKPIRYSMIKNNYKYRIPEKPKEYKQLIEKVENISKKLKRHCRIDVYCLNNKVYLGEFTFFCGAFLHTFICNFMLGLKWIMNKDDYSYQDQELLDLVPEFYNKP